jgi:DNA-directed RNA polymerase specialized sigma24 family protein
VLSAKEGTRLDRLNSGVTTILTRVKIKSPAEFYRHFYSKIYRFVFVQTGAPHDDVEDIVQEALLAAWRARKRYEGDSQLET